MESSRRLMVAGGIGVGVIIAAAASDFIVGSFWSGHAMLTSLLASLIVLAVTVVVLNEWLDRRDRRRWSVLAQYVLFQLVQSARVTWTTLVELLERAELQMETPEELLASAKRALDTPAISAATHALLADEERRRQLRDALVQLAEHSQRVIVNWASVMVGSGPYTDLFDRHVELQGRLDWLSEFLSQQEPSGDRSVRDTKLARSSVATEHAARLGSEEWLHDQLVATVQLAVRLDYQSRALAFKIVPMGWWAERTQATLGELSALSG